MADAVKNKWKFSRMKSNNFVEAQGNLERLLVGIGTEIDKFVDSKPPQDVKKGRGLKDSGKKLKHPASTTPVDPEFRDAFVDSLIQETMSEQGSSTMGPDPSSHLNHPAFKKFGFAGNVGPEALDKSAGPGKPELDMGTGVAAISEMLKEIDTVRAQGPDADFTRGPGSPGLPAPTGAPGGTRAASDIIPMTEFLTKNMIDAETPDALDLGKEEAPATFLTRAQNIRTARNEAMNSTEGVMSGLFDLAGMIAGIAGIHNASPALSLIGGKLGQEGKTMADNILDPFRQQEALLLKEFSDEIAGAKEGEFSPQQRLQAVKDFGEGLARQKAGGSDIGDSMTAIEGQEGILPFNMTDAERGSVAQLLESTKISARAQAEKDIPSLLTDAESNAVDYQVELIQEWFSTNKSDDTLMAEGKHDIVKLRSLRRAKSKELENELEKKLRQETTEGSFANRMAQVGKQESYGGFSFKPKTRKEAIKQSLSGRPITTETGKRTGIIGAETPERAFMSELLGLPDPNEVLEIPNGANIRNRTGLLRGVPERVTAEELMDKILDNLRNSSVSRKVRDDHVVVGKNILVDAGASSSPLPWVIYADDPTIQIFKETSSVPFNKEAINTRFELAIEEVGEKGLDMAAGDYEYFTPRILGVLRELLAEGIAELQ